MKLHESEQSPAASLDSTELMAEWQWEPIEDLAANSSEEIVVAKSVPLYILLKPYLGLWVNGKSPSDDVWYSTVC